MNIEILLSIICMIVGALLYMIATPPKLAELGRLMFACGLLAFLLTFTGRALHLTM